MAKIILAVLLMVIVGCSGGTGDTPIIDSIDRFVVTGRQYLSFGASAIYVICDTQTDLEYACHSRGGLTPLGTTCQPYVRLLSDN